MPNGALIRHRCNYPVPTVCLAGYRKFVDGKRILGCSAWSVEIGRSLDRRFVTWWRVVCRKENQQQTVRGRRVEPPAPPRSRSRSRCRRCRSVCAVYCSPPRASFGSLNLWCLPRETVNERTEPYRTHERAKPTSPSPSTALAIDRGAHCGRSSVLAETLYCSDVREVDQKNTSSKTKSKTKRNQNPRKPESELLSKKPPKRASRNLFKFNSFFLLPNKYLNYFWW